MKYFYSIVLSLYCLTTFSQTRQLPASELHHQIKKLNVLGSVLYLAAHPDDENTNLIAFMANERKYQTAYLSLTRGDGGQNIIGSELRELLGVIRTNELLKARSVDGGLQYFSRANDFGFSKVAEETLKIWNEKKILDDIASVIDYFKPDIIINRWDANSSGKTHGHHTASAILSVKAYGKAVKNGEWKPERLFFNDSWSKNKEGLIGIETGVYYPEKGRSNTEIAAESRSQHQCQGMGTMDVRGSKTEFFKQLEGSKVSSDLMEGINTTWTRVKGGEAIGQLLSLIDQNFDHANPEKSVPELMKAAKMIKALPQGHWRSVKLDEINTVIQGCLGLYVEATADDYSVIPGGIAEVKLELVNRSKLKVKATHFQLNDQTKETLNEELNYNDVFVHFSDYTAPKEYAHPYFWLNEPAEKGTYNVSKGTTFKPMGEPLAKAKVEFSVEGETFEVTTPIVYKAKDLVKGPVYRPFVVLPEASVDITEDSYLYPNNSFKRITVNVKAFKDNLKGKLKLEIPEGWSKAEASIDVELEKKGEEKSFQFRLMPPVKSSEGTIKAILSTENGDFDLSIIEIAYGHIPTQMVPKPATARVVRFNFEKKGEKIAYFMGTGDAIPENLRQVGYTVDVLSSDELVIEKLSQYDALIVGIRAYNTKPELAFRQKNILKYVENGGTVMVQYVNNYSLVTENLGPYPISTSTNRVTVEEAEITMLEPEHPALNQPNKITQQDFKGWVQERGLYFADEWDAKYTPLLAANDPGEPARKGGLLVAQYGKGQYVFTGYSFFRQLPAGVPGAYRLFANLIGL